MTEAYQPSAKVVPDFNSNVEGIAALGDPVRRALYRFVVKQGAPVSREQASSGVGVALHVAKFHLDRLEEGGLLAAEFRRPPGRNGPGAGRPTKLYRRSYRQLAVSLPERRYDLAGRIMAEAISSSEVSGAPVAEALHEAAATLGRSFGEEAKRRGGPDAGCERLLAAAKEVMDEYGYEPRDDGDATMLANCPFHALAQEYTALICGMNLNLLNGMLSSFAGDIEARLDPAPGRCCVRLSRP